MEKAGPRVAAMRAACKKHERDIAALCTQLKDAGLQPVLAPASARSARYQLTAVATAVTEKFQFPCV